MMKYIKIDKTDWDKGIEKLKASYLTVGPVKDQEFHNFKTLEKDTLPDLNCLNTRLSPKTIVYPQSQTMFEYSVDETEAEHHLMKEVGLDSSPRAVIGIRPCDAKAFLLVKLNFDTSEFKDPYWINSFEATSLIGLACQNPCSSCFCTTAGCGPFHEEGLDVLLVENDGHFLAKVMTERGEAVVTAAGWDVEVSSDAAENQIRERRAEVEAKIRSFVKTDRLKGLETTELYEASFWEDVAFSCINCGTCTYGCPTCWCFDIQDETYGSSGKRMRNWDSCMYPLFTLHGSGHNPRGTKTHRVRQRFMHKLKYFVDKYDNGIQCVGCGRCVRLCPVNIDIRNVCEKMNNYDASADVCTT